METRDITLIALFAALIAVLGIFPPITLPFVAVPITAQTLGVMLAGALLGARRGSYAVVLFLIIVAAGLPLLSGGRGGFAVFSQPSVGFLIGWLPGVYVIGLLTEKMWDSLNLATAAFINLTGGICVIYFFGILGLVIVADMGLGKAMSVSAAYVPGDLIKVTLAAMVAVAMKRGYPLIRSQQSRAYRRNSGPVSQSYVDNIPPE